MFDGFNDFNADLLAREARAARVQMMRDHEVLAPWWCQVRHDLWTAAQTGHTTCYLPVPDGAQTLTGIMVTHLRDLGFTVAETPGSLRVDFLEPTVQVMNVVLDSADFDDGGPHA